ncbi:MFS transporter [Nonomuraea sp. NN258]|uniref:MFS transporter n=1 Tax=Nonomuraea antri TaxID=2730852 RepID=UPI00156833A5|nr:MFS transporter [Nonomuraea antri]NRQ30286.1 MFS transporter [Nonomuraea antri]
MKAGRKQWIGLAVLVLPVLLISVDLHVLSYALPFISADLAPSGAQLLWIIDIYPFMLAGLLLPMGTLGDRIGRRRLLMAGAAAFGAASAVAAFSPSADLLIATRALLGVGGATLMPSTLSLIRNMFHDDGQRRTAIAIWTGAFAGGAMLGPLMGGALLEHFWWGSVFLVNLPVMALLLVLAPLLLPESRDPRQSRFDLLSVALSLGAILPTIYGIQHLAQDGLGWPPAMAIVIGLALGVAFVRRQRALADPMLDVRLFGSRAFTAAISANTLGVFAMVGSSLFTTQYLQMVMGARPLIAGLYALPSAGTAMLAAGLAPVLVRRIRPGLVVCVGLLVGAAGFALLSGLDVTGQSGLLIAGIMLMAGGVTLVLTVSSDLIIATAPPERSGSVAGLSQVATEFGGALGISLLGSIGTAVYRSHLGDTGAPAAALDTLGGALESARHLAGPAGGELAAAARAAFTQGQHYAMLAAAVGLFLMALLAPVMLRSVRRASPPQPRPDHSGRHAMR